MANPNSHFQRAVSRILENHDWSLRKYAKLAGLDHSAIGRELGGSRKLSADHFTALFRVRELSSQERVLLIKGWLYDHAGVERTDELIQASRKDQLSIDLSGWIVGREDTAMFQWWAHEMMTDLELAEVFRGLTKRSGYRSGLEVPTIPEVRRLARTELVVWTASVAGQCNYVNDAWLKFTGQTLDQALGPGWLEAIHPSDRDYTMRKSRKIFNMRTNGSWLYRVRRHDGIYMWATVQAAPSWDGARKFTGYVGTVLVLGRNLKSRLRSLRRKRK